MENWNSNVSSGPHRCATRILRRMPECGTAQMAVADVELHTQGLQVVCVAIWRKRYMTAKWPNRMINQMPGDRTINSLSCLQYWLKSSFEFGTKFSFINFFFISLYLVLNCKANVWVFFQERRTAMWQHSSLNRAFALSIRKACERVLLWYWVF